MKPNFGKYWIFISGAIIVNIIIFVFLSNRLETYVVDSMSEGYYENLK